MPSKWSGLYVVDYGSLFFNDENHATSFIKLNIDFENSIKKLLYIIHTYISNSLSTFLTLNISKFIKKIPSSQKQIEQNSKWMEFVLFNNECSLCDQ